MEEINILKIMREHIESMTIACDGTHNFVVVSYDASNVKVAHNAVGVLEAMGAMAIASRVLASVNVENTNG
jgi:hypothetical protein